MDLAQKQFLRDILHNAGNILLKHFGTNLTIENKNDHSIVTNADKESEAYIIARIKELYPEDIIFAEESAKSIKQRSANTNVWIIDPLDGTTNFANKYPFFCISIAKCMFLENGKINVLYGGIYDPIHNKEYFAQKGKGAYCNEVQLKILPPNKSFSECFLCTGFYYNMGQELSRDLAMFNRIAKECQAIRRDGAAALDLALVAEGVYDGFWERGLQPWDLAAATLIVQEAGGTIKNYFLQELLTYDLEGEGIIAGSSEIVTWLSKFV